MLLISRQETRKEEEGEEPLSSLSFSLSRGGGGQVTLSFFSILVVVDDGRP